MNSTETDRIYVKVCQAMESFNEQLPPNRKLKPEWQCELVGSPNLDSLELVNLMVMIEQKIEEDFGVAVSLFEMQDKGGFESFVTVEALVNSLAAKVAGRKENR